MADADGAEHDAFAGSDTTVAAQHGGGDHLRGQQHSAGLKGSAEETPPAEGKACGGEDVLGGGPSRYRRFQFGPSHS